MLELLPLALVFLVLFAVAAVPFSARLDRVFTRLALTVFGRYIRRRETVNRHQVHTLRAAHRAETYRVFASKTFLYATVAALAGSVLSVYGVAAVVVLVVAGNDAIKGALPGQLAQLVGSVSPGFSVLQLVVVFLAASATVGVVAAFATYRFRWSMVEYDAETRGRRIDASLQRNIAFMYALSRSGMAFTDIIQVLAENTDVYGATAEELEVVVKDVDMFGTDILASLRRLTARTPNDDLQEFAENLVSVLQSGQALPSFLHDEYDYFKEQAESKQAQFLELLATLAEAYVTVFVAGPLFLITVLVVIGLVMGGMLVFLRLLTYALLPVATVAFLAYLDSVTESGTAVSPEERADAERGLPEPRHADTPNAAVADGGVGSVRRKNRARLDAARRIRPVTYRLRHPLESLVETPTSVLYATVPLAVVFVAVELYQSWTAGSLALGTADDPVVLATLFVTGTFAVAYELRRRRVDEIEGVIPDFLDRLASTNEAGMSIVESVGRVVDSDLGALSTELDRVWADIQWGAHAETALRRFERRMQTATITRVTTLVTNAMGASGDLGPVLRIAADEAKASQRLKRERRTELLTYLIVIYLSFFVFIAIIVALVVVFIPSIPTNFGQLGGSAAGASGASSIPGGAPSFASGGGGSKPAYRLLLFHTALIQAVCSGFVAGHMGESSTKAGAKHATILLLVAYVVLLVFGG